MGNAFMHISVGLSYPISTKTSVAFLHDLRGSKFLSRKPFHVLLTTLFFVALFPKRNSSVVRQSIFSLQVSAILNLFLISASVYLFPGSDSLTILHSHVIFHIALDASKVTIVENLFALALSLPKPLSARAHPSCAPKQGFLKRMLHLSCIRQASSQIVLCPDTSHLVSMCSIVSITFLHTMHSALFLKFDMFSQYAPTLYALCIVFYRKALTSLDRALFF